MYDECSLWGGVIVHMSRVFKTPTPLSIGL